ncbi:hypothetical protein OG562_18055 [Streptomyces sp. NBC_01275]|uniref:hypothetical protein n=1 Tax=Streptomyces sp. NBC_01275 TaxID=2903807 RepID=UPI0022501368|nr:hypothetical protein [Streptomyces sp. NBC_01275]MCX4762845.1 hypothetical protein [Streptomyces sp. NBC_01275]
MADLDACFAPEVKRAMDAIPAVVEGYRTVLALDPPNTSTALHPLVTAMGSAGVKNDEKSRGTWLASQVPSGTGNEVRKEKLLSIWRDAGLWLHPQGTLEQVLSLNTKGAGQAAKAAQESGPIDAVSGWCAYRLDLMGDVFALLEAAVEKIAHSLMEAQRLDSLAELRSPVGPTAKNDARIVRVDPVSPGRHRLTVVAPQEFSGHWLEFSRDTPSSALILNPPEAQDVDTK